MLLNSNEKLIIFDGNSILNDFYHKNLTKEFQEWKKGNISKEEAFNSLLKSSSGKYINAIQGFLKLFFELMDIQNPSHVVVVWGSFKDNSFRNGISKEYKSTLEIDEPLLEQFSHIKKILSKMGVIQYHSHIYESQDLIGSIAKFFSNDIPTYILTRNSNLLQLIEYADIWIKTQNCIEFSKKFSLDLSTCPKSYILYNQDVVKNITGLEYTQVADYKALIGNKKSGIPGAKGIGKETALPLLKHFNSIENMYNIIDRLEEDNFEEYNKRLKNELCIKKNIVKLLIENKNNIILSKQLIEIKTDIISDLAMKEYNLNLSCFTRDFSIKDIINELKELDLTPILEINKIDLENEVLLSSLIQTYNTSILSPLSENFIGNNLVDINNISISNINSLIYLPDLNNITEIRNKSLINSVELKESVCNNIDTTKDELINDSIITNINTKNNSVNTSYNSNSNIGLILKTLPDNSLLKNFLEEDSTILDSINSTKTNNFQLLESNTINKYSCNNCNNTFITINSTPIFCMNCGVKFNTK